MCRGMIFFQYIEPVQSMTNDTMERGLSAPARHSSQLVPCTEQHPRNFMVIQDLHLTKGECLVNDDWSEAMSVFIVNSGVGKINFDSGEVYIRQNNIVQLPTDKLRSVSWDSTSFSVSGISFTGDFLAEMRITTELLPETPAFSSQRSFRFWELSALEHDRMRRQIGLLADYSRRFGDPYGKQILAHAFVAFLLDMESLGLQESGQPDRPASRQELYVQQFINLVQQQFREDRAIKDYAEQLNVSAKYLTQLVKQYTGKNASELITEQVIKEAKSLLRDPQLSIGQIADRLYFSDQSFFGKYFKRQTGISPKHYRMAVLRNGRDTLPYAANLTA